MKSLLLSFALVFTLGKANAAQNGYFAVAAPHYLPPTSTNYDGRFAQAILYTSDVRAAQPVWEDKTGDLPRNNEIITFVQDPNDPMIGYALTSVALYRTDNLFPAPPQAPSWIKIYGKSSFAGSSLVPDTARAGFQLKLVRTSKVKRRYVVLLLENADSFNRPDPSRYVYVISSTDRGNAGSWTTSLIQTAPSPELHTPRGADDLEVCQSVSTVAPSTATVNPFFVWVSGGAGLFGTGGLYVARSNDIGRSFNTNLFILPASGQIGLESSPNARNASGCDLWASNSEKGVLLSLDNGKSFQPTAVNQINQVSDRTERLQVYNDPALPQGPMRTLFTTDAIENSDISTFNGFASATKTLGKGRIPGVFKFDPTDSSRLLKATDNSGHSVNAQTTLLVYTTDRGDSWMNVSGNAYQILLTRTPAGYNFDEVEFKAIQPDLR